MPLRYIGITQSDTIAVEYDEFGDDRLAASIAAAESTVDALVADMLDQQAIVSAAPPPRG
ncbi:hypothetical protein QP166_08460 [Sphingomonas sp. LR60]|uniref:hypothetical protein n=1 Tax=Sphingomonas sp. LR60 TaxID=3050233 RepID=UPI002FE21165